MTMTERHPAPRPATRHIVKRRPSQGIVSRGLRKTLLNLAGLLVGLITLFPVLWMISTAFKPPTEIYSLTPHPIPLHPTLANFRHVIDGTVLNNIPYWTYLRNSLFITIVAVAISSLLALLAAIALARYRFRFRTTYLIMLLIVQMLPQQALVIALFINFRSLNLLDSLTGLIFVYTAFALPVTIWMLRNFAATVPRELEEAAQIDGAGAWTVFWRILLPLVSPGLVSTSVFAFIFAYNEFVFAVTFLSPGDYGKFTLPLYVQYFHGQNSTDWGAIMAASTLFTIPVLAFFLIIQRRLASGLVAGAVKG
jgi:N,N'-diacetylchitobiose transport system permease protein